MSRNRITIVNFEMARAGAISEVVVTAKLSSDDPRTPVTSFALSREEIRRSPGTGGDILRAMDSLPGATATGEFSSFQVRGRGPRDNPILVDGIPFDRVTHFDQSIGEGEDVAGGGRFSIFAPNLIQDADFLPGGFPVAYGGKNGSLLRLTVAEGNAVTPVFSGRAEITGWEVGYEGPTYVFDNTAALLSVRGQYFGPLLEWVSDGSIGSPTLYDIIGKTTSDLGPRDKLSMLGVYAPEMYERTVDNVLAGYDSDSPDAEFATFIAQSEQESMLLGGTWRRLVGDTGFLSNTFYFRYSDKRSSQGNSSPDQAGNFPPDAPALMVDRRSHAARAAGRRPDGSPHTLPTPTRTRRRSPGRARGRPARPSPRSPSRRHARPAAGTTATPPCDEQAPCGRLAPAAPKAASRRAGKGRRARTSARSAWSVRRRAAPPTHPPRADG